jgi:hypothetical protein
MTYLGNPKADPRLCQIWETPLFLNFTQSALHLEGTFQ